MTRTRARRARAIGASRRRGTPRAYGRRSECAAGASRHLVPPSRCGAPVRPTIDPGPFGTEGPLSRHGAGPSVLATPTRDRTGGHTWGVGHGPGAGRFLEEVRGTDPGTES